MLTLEKSGRICYNTLARGENPRGKRRKTRFAARKLKEKKMKQSTLKIITVAAVAFLSLLVIALVINVVKLGATNRRKRELAAEKARIERAITDADGKIDYFGSDEYVSRYAREYLNMKGEDEEAISGK